MHTPFTPRQIIFAPTARCNLACKHCRVERTRGSGEKKLTAEGANAFLENCSHHDIDRVGFSGGEPFLAPDFLESVCRKTVELGLYFDRLMTNGVWYQNAAELESTLARVFNAGFDGTLAISIDTWHETDPEKAAIFIRTAGTIAERFDFMEIVSVLNREGKAPVAILEALAANLESSLVYEGTRPIAIRNDTYIQNRDSGMDDGSGVNIPIITIPYSASANETDAWNADRWFADDWCEGPGNIFYVHPDGAVAVCCGFANENPQLIAGDIADGFESLLEKAQANPHVRLCYE